jgi:hypothetical protein
MSLDLQLPVQSLPITTNDVSLNPLHGKVYSIQHYSDLQQGEQDKSPPDKSPLTKSTPIMMKSKKKNVYTSFLY